MEKNAATGTEKLSSNLTLKFCISTHSMKKGRFGKQGENPFIFKGIHAEVLWSNLICFQSAPSTN